MMPLKMPDFSVNDVLQACHDSAVKEPYKNSILKIRNKLRPALAALESEYMAKARVAELFTLADPHENDAGVKKTLLNVYRNKISKKGDKVRSGSYDKIMSAAIDDKCPFCGINTANTIDHYLPKDELPSFAATPVNLVPCCMSCNFYKLAMVPKSKEEQLLHPYFDNVDDNQWLFAVIKQVDPLLVFFEARPNPVLDPVLQERIRNQFAKLKLNKYYSTEIAGTTSFIKNSLKNAVQATTGYVDIQKWLNGSMKDAKRDRINHWVTALFCALSESEPYREWLKAAIEDEIAAEEEAASV